MLLNMKEQFIKESNSLAANAAIKQHERDFSLSIKGQFMMKSNTLAGNAIFKHAY